MNFTIISYIIYYTYYRAKQNISLREIWNKPWIYSVINNCIGTSIIIIINLKYLW